MDVAVCVDGNGLPSLLTNDRLTFGALVDPQTGAVLNPIRRAIDRGLTFRLVPRRTGQGDRIEVKGSLHKFHNDGEHNADQFTADDLLLTLDQLVMDYGIDPFDSKINTIEFGVNVVLPFAAAEVLQNLVSYKNKPFYRDARSQTPYHECRFQQFTVKLYDKGKQKGFGDCLLRVEIKVMKMAYFNNTGVRLNALADLLNRVNYGPLGTLLVDTFSNILFDDPTIDPAALTPGERDIYQNGRNPRYWDIPKGLTPKQAAAHRQRLHRTEQRYRALLDQRGGGGWQTQTAALIGQTWQQLTTVDDHLLTRINERRAVWKNTVKTPWKQRSSSDPTVIDAPVTCHKLTNSPEPAMSQITPLYSALQCDTAITPMNTEPGESTASADRPGASMPGGPTPGESTRGAVICPVTGVILHRPKPGQRFISAAMLRNDDDLLMRLNSQFGQYAKGSKEDEYSRAAHNARNAFHNDPNNLRRRINRINQHPTLFDVSGMVRLTTDQRAALDHWQGTPYEVPV